jgi:hypothetical protein
MAYYVKFLTRVTDPLSWIVAFTFFTTAFFLVLKSTATTVLFLMFFICVYQIIKNPQHYLIKRDRQFWIVAICLMSPFFAELFAQIGRGDFIGPSLDGPSRAILATGVFVYLSRKNCANVLSALGIGSGIGILMVFVYIQIFPDHYWGNRAATYFVDPITLPCFIVALLGIFLFSNLPVTYKPLGLLFKILVSMFAIYIALESQSRSSWVALIALFLVYILYHHRRSHIRQILSLSGLVFAIFVIFSISDSVRERVINAYVGVQAVFDKGEGQQFSSAQRLILLQVDFELAKNNLFFGIADGVMPTYGSLKSQIPSLNEEIYKIKTFAGSHSEFTAQLVRKGVVFGSLAIWSLFLYPMYLIIRVFKEKSFLNSSLQKLLGIVTPIFFSALTIQVFNLKMTISFYVLSLAILFASHRYQNNRLNEQT